MPRNRHSGTAAAAKHLDGKRVGRPKGVLGRRALSAQERAMLWAYENLYCAPLEAKDAEKKALALKPPKGGMVWWQFGRVAPEKLLGMVVKLQRDREDDRRKRLEAGVDLEDRQTRKVTDLIDELLAAYAAAREAGRA